MNTPITPSYADTVESIKVELRRLNCCDTGNWTGIIVNQCSPVLPEGWASIGVNGAWTQYAPAVEILAALRVAQVDPAVPMDFEHDGTPVYDTGWFAAHAALNFSKRFPGDDD